MLFSGSEPVRQDSLQAFARHFAGTGFNPLAFLPCYGLAEATLFVTGTTADEPSSVPVSTAMPWAKTAPSRARAACWIASRQSCTP
ncbi:hypothetical protein FQZ97_1118690 [compost metagenome]